MRRLRWLESARGDLVEILEYVARESGSRNAGLRFVSRLRQRCADLARLPGTLGVARSELREDIRSTPFGRYVIFFQYAGHRLEIVNIIEGHRDLDALLAEPDSGRRSDK